MLNSEQLSVIKCSLYWIDPLFIISNKNALESDRHRFIQLDRLAVGGSMFSKLQRGLYSIIMKQLVLISQYHNTVYAYMQSNSMRFVLTSNQVTLIGPIAEVRESELIAIQCCTCLVDYVRFETSWVNNRESPIGWCLFWQTWHCCLASSDNRRMVAEESGQQREGQVKVEDCLCMAWRLNAYRKQLTWTLLLQHEPCGVELIFVCNFSSPKGAAK